MDIFSIARKPPITVAPEDSVISAVGKMDKNRVGAVAVVVDDMVVGIFTERDLLERVVKPRFSALDTRVDEVMTRNPFVVKPNQMDPRQAFEFMTNNHLRHLPVVDDDGHIQGMLSVRHLMRVIVGNLHEELGFLNAYITS